VKGFVGADAMAMHTMLINKPPDPGRHLVFLIFYISIYVCIIQIQDVFKLSLLIVSHSSIARGNGSLMNRGVTINFFRSSLAVYYFQFSYALFNQLIPTEHL